METIKELTEFLRGLNKYLNRPNFENTRLGQKLEQSIWGCDNIIAYFNEDGGITFATLIPYEGYDLYDRLTMEEVKELIKVNEI